MLFTFTFQFDPLTNSVLVCHVSLYGQRKNGRTLSSLHNRRLEHILSQSNAVRTDHTRVSVDHLTVQNDNLIERPI